MNGSLPGNLQMSSPENQAAQAAVNTSPRSYRSPRAWFVLLAILAVGLSADLGSKSFAFRGLEVNSDFAASPETAFEILPWGLLNNQLVVNQGAVFGLGADQRFFFIVFTIAALTVGLYVFGTMTRRSDTMAHVAIGLVLAGGIGNLYDRIAFAVVRDFLHMLPGRRLPYDWTWPGGSPEMFPWVFNVADMMLLCGMVLLMLHMSRMEKRQKALSASAVQSTPA